MLVKILILSDIHNQNITLEKILLQVKMMKETPDYCLIAGDITNFGTTEDLQEVLNIITTYFPKTYFIIGNCDPFVKLKDLETSAIHIESRVETIEFFKIVGFGTHKPKINHKLVRKLGKRKEDTCILTHVPPHNTLADLVSINRHAGSRELRKLIEENEHIFLVVSGHLHDSPTISKQKKQTIINPGSVTVGNFAIIEIQENLHISGNIYNLHTMGK